MRSNIRLLCVTTWNAVLELKTDTKFQLDNEICFLAYLSVADPDAIDSGQWIGIEEIKLVARIKKLK